MRVTTGRAGAGAESAIEGSIELNPGAGLAPAAWAPPAKRRAFTFDNTLAAWRSRTRFDRRALSGWIGEQISAQRGHGMLWLPVAFGLGAAAYLGCKVEPPLSLAAVIGSIGAIIWLAALRFAKSTTFVLLTGLLAAAGCGFFIAKVHSDRVAAPIAPNNLGVVRVDGWVVDIGAPSDRGPRLVIAPTSIAGLSPGATPTRVRIVVPVEGGPETVPSPGTAVRLLTLLDPPPGPAAPGAYDFARDSWFEGIGGVGLAMRPPETITLSPPPFRLRLDMAINAMRWCVAQTLVAGIRSVLGPGASGAGLAAAVTTSHQDWLPEAHRDDLRASGLAHMLAIAGLHTAAVSDFAFFAFRLAIAGWPWLALRVPGKKVAAVAGLIVVLGYLILSGAHPPARRAAITASIAFLAIIADRRAISLHSLALAALVILLIEPDVVLAPGFEMSFCATASLVALAEIWPRRASAKGLPWPLAAAQKARDGLIALTMVSLVAGAATSPFAIQHFNRVANYGVFANLTADFLASVVLMPALALSLLCQAVGLGSVIGAPLYWVAGWSADAIIGLAHIFASAPGAAVNLPSAPQIALAMSYLGIVFACLWRGRLRWLGISLGAAVAFWPRPAAPVAWIAADGDDAAVVVAGREIPMKPGMRAYATQLWAWRRGFSLAATPAQAIGDSARTFDCDRKGCSPIGPTRPALAGWWYRRPPSAERLQALCARADIFVTRADAPPPADCGRALVLDRASFARGGAAEIYATSRGWRLVWAQPLRGERPWTLSDSGG